MLLKNTVFTNNRTMMHCFYKLCQSTNITKIYNVQKYTIPSVLYQTHVDIIQNNVFDEIRAQPEQKAKIPIIACKRKEYNLFSGTMHKKFDVIAMAAGGWHHHKSKGDYFTIYPIFEVEKAKKEEEVVDSTFDKLNLDARLIENLKKLGLYKPTIIQKHGIPEIANGQNIAIAAETGCGKTFTYLLPIIDQILKWKPMITERPKNSPIALVITPSRELALQIAREAKKVVQGLGINIKTVVSGRTKKLRFSPSVQDVDILIGTIGVISKLTTWRIYKLNHLRHTVLDEAHALFDETFDDILPYFLQKINFGFKQPTNNIPQSCQLTLASATMPQKLPEYLSETIDLGSLINVTTPNFHRVLVPQKFLRLGKSEKPQTLLKLIKTRALHKEPTLIFSNSTATSDWISIFLNHMNIKAISLNGNMPDPIRKDRFDKFRRGEVNILSTTNASARGLDTTMVNCIINYDFPMNTADYIHRCGRTGRVGGVNNGRVINFISESLEIDLVQKIERSIRRGNPLPIFDIVQQQKEKNINAELKDLLGSEK